MADKDFKVKTGIDLPNPLPPAEGGTGQTSLTNAFNALLPAQAGNANKVLQTDGTNTQWYSIPAPYTRGGTASRPGSPTAGDLHFNTDKKAFEVWTGDAWVSVAVNGAVPLAPTIGTVTVSGLTASVPFTGPIDFGDSAISTYTATSNPGGITASNATSPISVSGLSANTSYTFTVTATNSFGTSNASSASNSITTANVPGAPTSVAATGTGIDGEAAVSWTAPASNGGSAITDYTIQYSSNSGSSWTTFSDGTSTSTSATVTGLTLNTAYIFRVAAVNIVGTGSYSTASASYTPIANDLGVLVALQTIDLTTSSSSVTFSNIPSTYSSLQLRMSTMSDVGDSTVFARFNGDTGSNYSWSQIWGNGTTTGSGQNTSATSLVVNYTRTSSNPGDGIVDIFDYASTSKNKSVVGLNGSDSNGSGSAAYNFSVWRNSSTAINSITFIPQSGNFARNSKFSLYGVKGQ